MNNKKSTKRALISSILSLALCMTMLIGTTFAWFTDSVTSSNNKIVAGNLDVQLLMDTGSGYVDISDREEPIFGAGSIAQNNNAETLWEPGKTQVAYLAIRNNGNLDLKYTVGLDVDNVSKNLYEVMEYAISPNAKNEDGLKVTNWEGGNAVVVGTQSVSDAVALTAGTTHYFALSIHMKEEAGNEYQEGQVNFDLSIFATQLMSEEDSFDNTYDEMATFLNQDEEGNWLISNAAELRYFAKSVNTDTKRSSYAGETVLLTADINLGGMNWTPIGNVFDQHEFAGTFDGQGHTISNFKVNSKSGSALFGFVRYSNAQAKVMNLTVKNVTATGGDYVAGVVGQLYGTIENCHAENVTAIATPFKLASGKYDGGAKAGGVVGWMESGSIYTATGCTAKNVSIKAYRDLGGTIGMAHNNNIITNCEAYDSILEYVYLSEGQAYDGNKVNENMGEVIGRRGTGVVETGTKFNNVILVKEAAISTTAEVQAALDSAKPGDVITLASGNYGTLTIKNFWNGNYTTTGITPITIRSTEGAKVEAIDLNGMNFITIDGLTFDAAKAIQVYAGGPSGDYGNIVDSGRDESKSRGANHITVKNCTFTGAPTVEIGKYCPINFMGSNPSSWTYDIVVSGCKFLTNAQNFIRMNNVTNNGSVLIENNIFGGQEYTTNHHAINASANGGDWTIKGNTFINWNPKKCAFATGRSSAEGTTDFVITGNTFSNTRIPTVADGDDGVIEIKTNSYTTTNQTLVFEGNTFAGALAGLDETTIKYVKP